MFVHVKRINFLCIHGHKLCESSHDFDWCLSIWKYITANLILYLYITLKIIPVIFLVISFLKVAVFCIIFCIYTWISLIIASLTFGVYKDNFICREHYSKTSKIDGWK